MYICRGPPVGVYVYMVGVAPRYACTCICKRMYTYIYTYTPGVGPQVQPGPPATYKHNPCSWGSPPAIYTYIQAYLSSVAHAYVHMHINSAIIATEQILMYGGGHLEAFSPILAKTIIPTLTLTPRPARCRLGERPCTMARSAGCGISSQDNTWLWRWRQESLASAWSMLLLRLCGV